MCQDGIDPAFGGTADGGTPAAVHFFPIGIGIGIGIVSHPAKSEIVIGSFSM